MGLGESSNQLLITNRSISIMMSRLLLPYLILGFLCLGLADVTVDKPYSERIEDAFWGFIAGIFLVVFSIPLMWIVEKQAVEYSVILSRCRKALRFIPDADKIVEKYEDRAVFLKGNTDVADEIPRTAHDSETGFQLLSETHAIRLRRTVEVYQWIEHKKEKEKQTIYSYSLEWSETDHDSNRFIEKGHNNPPRNPSIRSKTVNAGHVNVGAYELSEEQIEKFHHWKLCEIKVKDSPSKNFYIEQGSKKHESDKETYTNITTTMEVDSADYIVYNGHLQNPEPGTMRVSYEVVYEGGPVSLVGVQRTRSFRPFTKADAYASLPSWMSYLGCGPPAEEIDGEVDVGCCFCVQVANMVAGGVVGKSVLLLEERDTTPANMFYDESVKLSKRLNLMRLAGCALLSLGIYLIFNPIAVVLSFIPYLSGLMSNLFFLAAILLGFVLGGIVISLAWAVYHPEYLTMLLLAVGMFLFTGGSALAAEVVWAVACVPLLIWVLHLVDDVRFARLQHELDEKSPLLTDRSKEV